MKGLGIAGLCLALALAASAVGASNALAFKEEAPEVGRCVKHTGGRFKTSGCTVAAKVVSEQKFEWYPGFGPNAKGEEQIIPPEKRRYAATSKELTTIELDSVKGEGVFCTKQTSEGEFTGAKTNRNFNIVFTGCEAAGIKCKGTNPKATNIGEILVKELDGTIGVEKLGATSATNKLANLFKPAEGEVFTEFECSGLKIGVRGEVMVPISVDKMLSSMTVKFTATKGKQKPEKFATDPTGTKRVLFEENSQFPGELIQAGQTLTTIQSSTTGEKLEANTVN
jgi:hypothetical protein